MSAAAALRGAALLDCDRPAEDLSALVRAASFAAGVKRRGMPKLWLDESMAAVRSLQVGAASSSTSPGTRVSATPRSLDVATASRDVAPAGDVILLHGGLPAAQIDKAARQLATLAEDGLARPGSALGDLAVLPRAEIGRASCRERV